MDCQQQPGISCVTWLPRLPVTYVTGNIGKQETHEIPCHSCQFPGKPVLSIISTFPYDLRDIHVFLDIC